MKFIRILIILLLCITLACAPMATLAEVQAQQIPIDPTPEPDPILPPEMPEAVDVLIVPAAEPTAEPTLPPSAPPTKKVSGHGYFRLSGAATGYASAAPDAQALLYLESGVLYVSDRRSTSSGDRMRAHFICDGQTRSAWVDSRALRSMDEGDTAAFIAAHSGSRGYGGDPNLPLDEIACSSVVTYSMAAPKDKAAVPAMFVGETDMTLSPGEAAALSVSFSDGQAHRVSFASDDESIAAVDDQGRVTGVAPGSTRVHLRSEFSNEASVEILVTEK